MDKRKEKYINYVVDDMIKKTEIDYDQEKIKYPFSTSLPSSFFILPLFLSLYSPSISKYVIERYGIHDNDVDNTWDMYKERIQSLINNG